jgi:hypothetical protein
MEVSMIATGSRERAQRRLTALFCGALFACAQCGEPEPEALPITAPTLSPSAYVAKVKNLLTGLSPTAEELAAVSADGKALAPLIDGWMARPEFQRKMLDFFTQSFQQTQVTVADYEEQLGMPTQPWNPVDRVRFQQSAEQSFSRTVWQLIEEGRPFTEVATTERFMLNPPLMAALAFMDAWQVDDSGLPRTAQSWLLEENRAFAFTRQTKEGPIPIAETLDPTHANYMKWYDPNPYRGPDPRCAQDPQRVAGLQAIVLLGDFMFGGRPGCGTTASQFQEADYGDFRMVTIRPPRPGEKRTRFYDIPSLRKANELVLLTPRMGFMTTPAFFANWPTNSSNLARVTINQTLIVALGKSFDDSGTTVVVQETTKPDAQHVDPSSVCYSCHSTLDPMRDYFRASYTLNYHLQRDAQEAAKQGSFLVDGVVAKGHGIGDLGRTLAAHPSFAPAWVQKLCRYANSAPCSESDPEFLRVAAAFRDGGHGFKGLVRTLFSSPLITFAEPTESAAAAGLTIGIARREHLCAALENRLGIADLCGLRQERPDRGDPNRRVAHNLALSIPGTSYVRGAVKPLIPHDPTLFFQSATENLCGLIADKAIDAPSPGAAVSWSSAQPDAAIADFLRIVMAVPDSDARTSELGALLHEHFTDAKAAGESASDALRSTFVLACTSPLALSLGL